MAKLSAMVTYRDTQLGLFDIVIVYERDHVEQGKDAGGSAQSKCAIEIFV